MTIAAESIVGSTRIIVLAPTSEVVRGRAAEFRRFGLSIVVRDDILAALTEVVHDPAAMLVVSADVPGQKLDDVLDLAVAVCRSRVLLGMTSTTDTAAISAAFRAGVRATVELPLSPEQVARTMRVLPAVATARGPIRIGDLTVDSARHRIDWAGDPIEATPREFAVVLELAQNHPRIVPLDELASGYQGTSADHHAAVRVVINHVRARIADVAGSHGAAIIETVRGVGYRIAG